MASNNGIITAPVTVKEVADLLNSSGSGASTKYDVGSVCTSGRINMWAKYKPFNHSSVFFEQDDDDTKTDRAQALSLAGYGLSMQKKTGSQCNQNGSYGTNTGLLVSEAINNLLPDWAYTARTVPYRLADFLGYYHNALAPVRSQGTLQMRLDEDKKFSYGFYVNFDGDGASDGDKASMTLSDLRLANDSNQLGNYYFGVILYADSTHYDIAVMSETINEAKSHAYDMIGLEITATNVSEVLDSATYRECHVIPIISTQNQESTSAFNARSMYPFGFAIASVKLKKYSSVTDVPLYAGATTLVIGTSSTNPSKKAFYIYYYIRNNSNASITVKDLTIRAYCDSLTAQSSYVVLNEKNFTINGKSVHGYDDRFVEVAQGSAFDAFMNNADRYEIIINTGTEDWTLSQGAIYHVNDVPEW